jgi:hypothetical protein
MVAAARARRQKERWVPVVWCISDVLKTFMHKAYKLLHLSRLIFLLVVSPLVNTVL